MSGAHRALAVPRAMCMGGPGVHLKPSYIRGLQTPPPWHRVMRWEHCPILGNEQDQKEQLGRAPLAGSLRIMPWEHPCSCGPAAARGLTPVCPRGSVGAGQAFPRGRRKALERQDFLLICTDDICTATWRNKGLGCICTLSGDGVI